MTLQEMLQKRAKLVADAKALNDLVLGEKRDFTQEEQNTWDALMTDADGLKSKIDRQERLDSLDRSLDESRGRMTGPQTGDENPDPAMGAETGEKGRDGLPVRATDEYRSAFQSYLSGDNEKRAVLQTSIDNAGGYLVPEQIYQGIIHDLEGLVFLRGISSTMEVQNATPLGVPYESAGFADADWTAEVATIAEDTALTFGRRNLAPSLLAKRIKVSQKMIRMLPDIDGYLQGRMADKFATAEENAFLNGDGADKPLGVFVASDNGIPAARDFETATATKFTADELIDTKYGVKQQYANRGVWAMHRSMVKMAAKLKDSNGQYLWQPGLHLGKPDTLLGHPLYVSEYAPDSAEAGAYAAIFGDFSYYWIVDALTMSIQRLDELYAETSQVGLIGRREVDAMPVLGEAFSRLKFKAA